MVVRGKKIKYDVSSYLSMLRLSGRSKYTIDGYRKVLASFARFLDVPPDQVHNHLSVANVLKFAESRKDSGRSEYATKNRLSVIHRYCVINGVVFDEMQYNAVKPRVVRHHDDKPITHTLLRAMMDLTDEHGKAILAWLASTGARPGSETCEILLSDLKLEKPPGKDYWQLLPPERGGDTVIIRNEIAKGGRGGTVYLTAEAQEWINAWLKVRDQRIRSNNRRARGLRAGPRPAGEDTRRIIYPRKNDQRLFAISYSSLRDMFDILYDKVDGEQGRYKAKCTPHSCRKFFRTQATQGGLSLDIVEHIMRHEGYLTRSYVRLTDDEIRKTFHRFEHALYITRPHHRNEERRLEEIKAEYEDQIATVMKRLKEVEDRQERDDALRKWGETNP